MTEPEAETDIQTYINSLAETHSPITRDKYHKRLIQINKKIALNSSEEEIWNYIEGTDTKIATKRSKQFLVKTYRVFHKLPVTYFEVKLKKNSDGEYINTDTPSPVEKEVKNLPEDYQELINKIENGNHKLLLRLLTEYDEVLRCDLAFVRKTDIIDNSIVIKETNKTKQKITIKLRQEDLDLIDFGKEYLIHFNRDTKDRSNAYTKLVKRITKRYLGVEFTQTNFRSWHATKSYKKIEHLPGREQQVELRKQATKRAHSAATAISNYIDKTDDINVSLDYKKTINILKDGKVVGSYNIEQVVKVMTLYKAIKEVI